MKFLASALVTLVVFQVGSSMAQTRTLAPLSQPQPPATSQDTTQQLPADVYFFAAYKPTPDCLSGNAVAEFDRRKTTPESKTARTVSYRNQNGIVTFSRIETHEFVVRFTLIPFGSAN